MNRQEIVTPIDCAFAVCVVIPSVAVATSFVPWSAEQFAIGAFVEYLIVLVCRQIWILRGFRYFGQASRPETKRQLRARIKHLERELAHAGETPPQQWVNPTPPEVRQQNSDSSSGVGGADV